jgi:hypothetical protein
MDLLSLVSQDGVELLRPSSSSLLLLLSLLLSLLLLARFVGRHF